MNDEERSLAPSPTKLLVDWANEQDSWARRLVSEVIQSRQAVSDVMIEETHNFYLVEKGLAEGSIQPEPLLEFEETASAEDAGFVLGTLEGVKAVNALADGQSIDFNPGLTVLFGENGAGKTGYARILKQLAAVRTAEPILPNVYDPAAPTELEASVSYTTGSGDKKVLQWRGESGVPPFTRLCVFDSPAIHLHVDENLTYSYTPADLALFPLIDIAIGAARDRLDAKCEARRPAANPFLGSFTRGTTIYQLIETLGAATELAELERVANTSTDGPSLVVAARTKVEALQSTSTATQLVAATTRRDMYSSLEEVSRTCSSLNVETFNQAVEDSRSAAADIHELRSALFEAAGLSDEDHQEWQEFIASGENYLEHIGKYDYPSESDSCIYCQQPLGDDARSLIRKYRDFAADAAQKRAAAALSTMDTLTTSLRALSFEGIVPALESELALAEDDAILIQAKELLDLAHAAQQSADSHSAIDRPVLTCPDQWVAEIVLRREASDALIAEVSGKVAEREEALGIAQTELNELRDAVELGTRISVIRTYVSDSKWVLQAAALSRRIPPIRASLTTVAKVASEQLINTDFAQRFEKERVALRAPEVGLEFPGEHGRAARRKTMPVAKLPSDVLSEGEQKVIALADFLAEAGLRLTPSPLVFDDPVTSLDYRRIREVSDRVAELAQGRQVIVFTHNIWFTSELLARFEKNTARCNYYGITDDPAKGTVVRGNHPRWDTVRSTSGKINALIQNARSAKGAAVQEALIESAYSSMRGWCETVVEMELLQGVTQRYQPNVMMTSVSKIKVDRLKAAFDIVVPIFEKACRVTEAHSQPLETLSIRPTLAELESDWESLEHCRREYLA